MSSQRRPPRMGVWCSGISFTINSMKSGTLASEALPLTSSRGMMISPRIVMVAISSGVKKVFPESSFMCSISSFIRLWPLGLRVPPAAAVLSAPAVAGFFSPVLQASARAPAETVVMRRVLMLFLLSIIILRYKYQGISIKLDITFFHFIYDVFAGTHRQGQDGPGDVLISL